MTMLSDAQIESFAIRAANGNKGEEWPMHCNEDDKSYWRHLVRDLVAEIRCGKPQPATVLASAADHIEVPEWMFYEAALVDQSGKRISESQRVGSDGVTFTTPEGSGFGVEFYSRDGKHTATTWATNTF